MIVTGNTFRPNVNPCSDCGERVLPEPIVFAQLCRVTSMYVCNTCYVDNQESHDEPDEEELTEDEIFERIRFAEGW